MRTPISSTQDIGRVVRAVRRQSRLRLEDLAATTGLRRLMAAIGELPPAPLSLALFVKRIDLT